MLQNVGLFQFILFYRHALCGFIAASRPVTAFALPWRSQSTGKSTRQNLPPDQLALRHQT